MIINDVPTGAHGAKRNSSLPGATSCALNALVSAIKRRHSKVAYPCTCHICNAVNIEAANRFAGSGPHTASLLSQGPGRICFR